MRNAFVAAALFVFSLSLLAQDSGQQEKINQRLDSLSTEVEKLNHQLQKFKEKEEEKELEDLKKAARQEIGSGDQKKRIEKKTFHEGSRSLQGLNPEISVNTDFFANYKTEPPHYTDDLRSGFHLRVAEVVFQANLDPFSTTKIIIEASPDEFALAEAYMTWINLLPRVNLTAGKFRQQFGVVNRWHEHALDQLFYPLPIVLYMGEEGLNQVGLSTNWLLPPLIASSNELVLQLTNSQNETLFTGEDFSLPATLLHFKSFYDLSPSTYLEWGLSGLAGTNDDIGFTFAKQHSWTYLAGADVSVVWEPPQRARFRSVTWRSELYYLYKEQMGDANIKALGFYSYVDYRFSQRYIGGVRFDYAQPPEIDNSGKFLWQVVPYLTFWQSEFVYLRLEADFLRGHQVDETDTRVFLQINWSIGPHKHEKY